jgi:hypothetical protein
VDVQLAVGKRMPIDFYGSTGGLIPSVEKVIEEVHRSIAGQGKPGPI